MPEFSGLDVFAFLRNEGLREKRNVVVFTASNLAETEIADVLRWRKSYLKEAAIFGRIRPYAKAV